MTEYAPAKTGEYPSDIPQVIFPNFPNFKLNVKMGERFAFVTEDINLTVDKAVPESTKKSTSYAVNVFDGKLFVNISSKL